MTMISIRAVMLGVVLAGPLAAQAQDETLDKELLKPVKLMTADGDQPRWSGGSLVRSQRKKRLIWPFRWAARFWNCR